MNALQDTVLNYIHPNCLHPYSLSIFFSSLRPSRVDSLTLLFVQKDPAALSVRLLFPTHSPPVGCLFSFRLLFSAWLGRKASLPLCLGWGCLVRVFKNYFHLDFKPSFEKERTYGLVHIRQPPTQIWLLYVFICFNQIPQRVRSPRCIRLL